MKSKRWAVAVVGAMLLILSAAPITRAQERDHGGDHPFRHVLLISIDGMHSLDFINCSQGIATVNGGAPYCPTLAALSKNGVS